MRSVFNLASTTKFHILLEAVAHEASCLAARMAHVLGNWSLYVMQILIFKIWSIFR